MPARLGKSSAINRVIQELKDSDDVFVMTDAEPIGRWSLTPSRPLDERPLNRGCLWNTK